MQGCLFGNYCTESECDRSCPILAETSYLLERNGITINSDVFKSDKKDIETAMATLQKAYGSCKYVRTKQGDSIKTAELYAYCSICSNWKGSQLHCTVYTLKFAKYIEAVKRSFGTRRDVVDDLDYIKIWAENSKVLIITGFDYMKLGEFECQILDNTIQARLSNSEFTTILVGIDIDSLVGEGTFFLRFKEIIRNGGIVR